MAWILRIFRRWFLRRYRRDIQMIESVRGMDLRDAARMGGQDIQDPSLSARKWNAARGYRNGWSR